MSAEFDSRVELLVTQTWELIAARLTSRIASQLAGVQRELLDLAQTQREAGESGSQIADHLEKLARRLTHAWLPNEVPSPPPSEVARDTTRSRGRPRKASRPAPRHHEPKTVPPSPAPMPKEPTP